MFASVPYAAATPAQSAGAPFGWAAFEHIARAQGMIAAIGSLAWKPIPGTYPLAPITIEGFRKDLNTKVSRCRGTQEVPGLVMGLEPDSGAAACALLLRVAVGASSSVWSQFRARELDGVGYVPTMVPARRRDTGEVVLAAAVLADTRSPSYVRAAPAELAAMIRQAQGSCGSNLEYVRECLASDRQIHGGLPDHLAALEAELDGG